RSLERLVTREAGLLGVSGTSPDMQVLLAQRASNPDAALAVDMFCYQIRKAIGGLSAVLGGLDTLVFTGGIGEHAPVVRSEICAGLEYLGITLDPSRNESSAQTVNCPDTHVTVRIVHTNEEQMIARHARRVLHNS